MRKIIIFLVLVLIGFIGVYLCSDSKVDLPNVSSAIVQSSIVTTTYKGYDISSFIVPNPKDVSIELSENINLDSTFCMPSGDTISVRETIIHMGKSLFQKKTGIRRSGCVDCHSHSNGGTGFTNRAAGGGEFWETWNEFYEMWTGMPTYIEADKKPFKNWSTLNSWRLHRDGVILTAGIKSDHPLEHQIGVAVEEAHFLNDLLLECQTNPFINQVSMAIHGRPFDFAIAKMWIAAFEFTLTTWDNRMNLIARYPDQYEVENIEGLELFLKHGCNDCHANNTMAEPRVEHPVNDLKVVKSPGLDNNIVQHQGYFHTADEITIAEAVMICGKLTEDESELVADFIVQNLTSPSYY